MTILAIETSTQAAGVALWREGSVIAAALVRDKRELAARLARAIESLLSDAGIDVGGLGGVAVDRGPGSFTGLRVGLATAKMLAHARALPVVGVSSLEAAAWRCRSHCDFIICPVLRSHRDQLYAAAYRAAGKGLKCVIPECATEGGALIARLNTLGEPVLFCAEAADLPREWLTHGLTVGADFAHSEASLPTAGAVAELGGRRLAGGEDDGALALSAHYLRKSSAETDATRRGEVAG